MELLENALIGFFWLQMALKANNRYLLDELGSSSFGEAQVDFISDRCGIAHLGLFLFFFQSSLETVSVLI